MGDWADAINGNAIEPAMTPAVARTWRRVRGVTFIWCLLGFQKLAGIHFSAKQKYNPGGWRAPYVETDTMSMLVHFNLMPPFSEMVA
jgi:hypothetical protein